MNKVIEYTGTFLNASKVAAACNRFISDVQYERDMKIEQYLDMTHAKHPYKRNFPKFWVKIPLTRYESKDYYIRDSFARAFHWSMIRSKSGNEENVINLRNIAKVSRHDVFVRADQFSYIEKYYGDPDS